MFTDEYAADADEQRPDYDEDGVRSHFPAASLLEAECGAQGEAHRIGGVGGEKAVEIALSFEHMQSVGQHPRVVAGTQSSAGVLDKIGELVANQDGEHAGHEALEGGLPSQLQEEEHENRQI